VTKKDDLSVEDANEEGKRGYPKGGETDDLLPMNPEGDEADVPQGFIGLPMPM